MQGVTAACSALYLTGRGRKACSSLTPEPEKINISCGCVRAEEVSTASCKAKRDAVDR
jgi:hypothetical protein